MNLIGLFEKQKVLDEKIYARFPGLKEEPWDWKILALLTELGECANEHRGFKKWSRDQEPRTKIPIYQECIVCSGVGYLVHDNGIVTEDCVPCKAEGRFHIGDENPLLEEYVDCLHFFISIAIELGMFPNNLQVYENYTESTVEKTFNKLFCEVSKVSVLGVTEIPAKFITDEVHESWYIAFSIFVGIGEQFLGFTWKQIETAYFEKNEINHARQNNGY